MSSQSRETVEHSLELDNKVDLITWNHAAGSLGTFTEDNSVGTLNIGAVSGVDGSAITTTLSSGSIPFGLSMNHSTGELTGTLSNQATTSTASFTLSATAQGKTSTRTFTITNNADQDVPTWTTSAGALTAVGGSSGVYNQTVVATDPEGGAITYSVVSGSLPTGLSINSSTGAITGTATNLDGGTSSFTLRATDSSGATADRGFTIERQQLHNLQNGHTPADCIALGGEFMTTEGICRFTGAATGTVTSSGGPAGDYDSSYGSAQISPTPSTYDGDVDCPNGWTQYNNWSTMAGSTSRGSGTATTSVLNSNLGTVTVGVRDVSIGPTGTDYGNGNRDITDTGARRTITVNDRAWADSTVRPTFYYSGGSCAYSCDNGGYRTRWNGYEYFWWQSIGNSSRRASYADVQARRSQIGCV